MKISIHVGRSVQVLELAKRMHRRAFRDADDIDHKDYMELVEQFLAYIESKASTRDDAQPGHPFYGNQYTEGGYTAKPKEAKSKIPKHAVHELLSSGHPFHIDELAEITGHANKTSLQSWISMFKKDNPKGKLDIVKVGPGTYQVMKKDGTPAPAAPMPKEEVEFVAPKDPTEQPTKLSPPAPDPEPAATPSDPYIDPLSTKNPNSYGAAAATYKHPPIVKPPAPIPKAEADATYAKTQQHQIQVIQNLGKYLKHNGIDVDHLPSLAMETIATAFKTGKSAAMAQWATSTNAAGKVFEPKPVEVFPEDLEHLKKLAKTDTPEEAAKVMAEWKKATHEAKMAAVNKKNQETAAAKKAEEDMTEAEAEAFVKAQQKEFEAKTAELMKEPPALPVPKAIVPEGHQHIGSSDFDPDPTSPVGSSIFKRGITRAHNLLVNESTGSSQGNKQVVQKKLEARLAASPHFQVLQKQYAASPAAGYDVHKGSLASRLIGQWATSSGDYHAISVAAQLAIREAFKMDPSKVETKAFHYLKDNSEETTHYDAAKQLGIDVSTPEKMAVFKKGMQDFALAQYHETQEFFKSKGITHLHLVRGMRMGLAQEFTQGAKKVKLKLQPASSFTVNHTTAAQFAGTGSLFAVKVPVEQVMGSYMTGYGCTGEHEVVVLAHESLEGIQVGVSHAKSTGGLETAIKTARKHNGGVLPGETPGEASATSTAAGKSYISSPTPPALKVKIPKPDGGIFNSTMLGIKNAAIDGDWSAVEQKLSNLQSASMMPGFNKPKTLQYAESVHKAYLEAKAEHATKMQKWKTYHQKHKTGVV